MRLTSLQLHSPELRLDDLSPGFNLIFAPQGETRRLIPTALHCVLFGAPSIEIYPDDDHSICQLDVLSSWGRFELQRVISPEGDRFLARDSKGQNRGKWLRQRMLAETTEGAFASIFTPRFGDHASFESLVRQALGESGAAQRRASLESLLREFEASRPWDRQAQEAAKLHEQEARLLAELERLDDAPHEETRATVSLPHERRIKLWQSRLRKTRQRMRNLRQQLERVRSQSHAPDRAKTEKLLQRVLVIDQRIERLENVLSDLRQREQELLERQREAMVPETVTPASHTRAAAGYHQIVQSLAQITRQLESEVTTLNAQPDLDSSWTSAADRLLPRLESLNVKLQQLCQKLRHQQVPVVAGQQSEELVQLARCQHDLSAQLAVLIQRREFLHQQLRSTQHDALPEVGRVEAMETRLLRLERQEGRCEAELTRLHAASRRNASDSSSPRQSRQRAEIHHELAEVRIRLTDLTRQDQQESEVMLQRMRALLTDRRIPVIFEEASHTLRQLTDGELVAIRPRTWGNDVVIEHAHGKAVTFDVLSRGERDQVQLSLSLATAADAAQRGCTFPLVLDDALRHMEPGRLRSAVELLRDHCRLHGQILLLSSQQNVATLCRSIGVASFYLDHVSGAAVAGTFLGRAAEQIGAIDEDRSHQSHGESSLPEPDPIRNRTLGIAWESEELPGDFRDRVHHNYLPFTPSEMGRRPSEFPHSVRSHWDSTSTFSPDTSWNSALRHEPSANGHDKGRSRIDERCEGDGDNRSTRSSRDFDELDEDACPAESLRGTGYFLQLCDRMTEAPFTTRAISRAIENCGIYTVANFLHADSVRLSERLQELDVSASQLRRWQGQARLMCGVRKLRSYDAKILVACGVTSPEQLADIRPHELSEMVEAFVATPEGSRIVRSGSDFEISRITRWIRSVSRIPSTTIPLRAGNARPSSSARGNGVVGTDRPVVDDVVSSERSGQRESMAADVSRNGRPNSEVRSPSERRPAPSSAGDANLLPLKFFLEESSHVEAAPSIGPQMAQRLEKIGIVTVANLLAYEPADIAEELQHRRVSAEVVRQWQCQAELVCRIPQLRGHDAQILVACDVITPEDLASRQPEQLYSEIMPFVRSKAGQRILRQGKEPTLEEVTDWINWAHYARNLAAA